MPGEVEVDDLRRLREPREVGLEVGVVEASRAAVQQQHRRPLPHRWAVRYERRPVDVEPEPAAVCLDAHGQVLHAAKRVVMRYNGAVTRPYRPLGGEEQA
jgi:hypothetical protein